MPDTIPAHYTTEFHTNFMMRVQQTKARLDDFVTEENYVGERKRFDRLAAMRSHKRTERKGPTHIQDVNSDSRWAYHSDYDLANLLDKKDAQNLGKLVLPTSEYVASHTAAYNRDKDIVAWEAAIDPVKIGENGTESYSLPSSQVIVHGSTGLTIAKLITMNEILEGADLEDGAPRVLVVAPRQISNLLNTTQATSSDYAAVKALHDGKITQFMGFEFRKSNFLRKSGSTRTCVAWVKGAIQRIKGDITSDISIRKDLSYSTQIYSEWTLGATRRYDEGVVVVECTE